jgi:hypothetical protein
LIFPNVRVVAVKRPRRALIPLLRVVQPVQTAVPAVVHGARGFHVYLRDDAGGGRAVAAAAMLLLLLGGSWPAIREHFTAGVGLALRRPVPAR